MWDIESRIMPDWLYGIAGNITSSHYDENGVLRSGTKAFLAGTKVYLSNWIRDDGKILVVGLSRKRIKKRRKYIEELVDLEYIENIRPTRIFNTAVIERMILGDGYGPFADMEEIDGRITLKYTSDYFMYWGNTLEDRDEIDRFIERWKSEEIV